MTSHEPDLSPLSRSGQLDELKVKLKGISSIMATEKLWQTNLLGLSSICDLLESSKHNITDNGQQLPSSVVAVFLSLQ